MELIINLAHDVVWYSKERKEGVLKTPVLGYSTFEITETGSGFEVDFINEDYSRYTYECKFTDHEGRLVVYI